MEDMTRLLPPGSVLESIEAAPREAECTRLKLRFEGGKELWVTAMWSMPTPVEHGNGASLALAIYDSTTQKVHT